MIENAGKTKGSGKGTLFLELEGSRCSVKVEKKEKKKKWESDKRRYEKKGEERSVRWNMLEVFHSSCVCHCYV